MCIACELGYWSMIDAIEAERSTSKSKAARADEASDFVCEAPADQPKSKSRSRRQEVTDEREP